MRFVDVSSFYADRGGGVRTYHQNKLAYFALRREHHYTLITAGEHASRQELPGGVIWRLEGFVTGREGGYRQLYDVRKLERALDELQPDVIEIGSAYLDNWLVLLAQRSRRRRARPALIVGFFHADFPDSYVVPWAARLPRAVARPVVALTYRYCRWAYGSLDATCVTSAFIQRKLAQKYRLDPIVLVPLGVDLDLYCPRKRDPDLRRHYGLTDAGKLVLYAGRFRSEKNIDVILDAARLLPSGAKLVLVGGGPNEREVRQRVADLPAVVVEGFVEQPQRMAALYASADVLVAPSPHETFGLAAAEAMASGCPVLSADRGATAELVTNSGAGALFDPQSARDLVAQLRVLLEGNTRDLGMAGRHYVERHGNWETSFDHQVDSYRELHHAKLSRNPVAARRHAGLAASD